MKSVQAVVYDSKLFSLSLFGTISKAFLPSFPGQAKVHTPQPVHSS